MMIVSAERVCVCVCTWCSVFMLFRVTKNNPNPRNKIAFWWQCVCVCVSASDRLMTLLCANLTKWFLNLQTIMPHNKNPHSNYIYVTHSHIIYTLHTCLPNQPTHLQSTDIMHPLVLGDV